MKTVDKIEQLASECVAPSDEELRVQVAKLLGWRYHIYGPPPRQLPMCPPGSKGYWSERRLIPYYHSDLNVISKVIKQIDPWKYQWALMQVVFGIPCTGWPYMHVGERQQIMEPTARQKAEAVVLALS